jgi:hypothetical protein
MTMTHLTSRIKGVHDLAGLKVQTWEHYAPMSGRAAQSMCWQMPRHGELQLDILTMTASAAVCKSIVPEA